MRVKLILMIDKSAYNIALYNFETGLLTIILQINTNATRHDLMDISLSLLLLSLSLPLQILYRFQCYNKCAGRNRFSGS